MAHAKAGRPKQAPPVKYFAAVLASRDFDCWEALLQQLESILGRVDYRGRPVPFDMTDYYDDEMGAGTERTIIGFSPLGRADDLSRVKHASFEVEQRFSSGRGRRVNIDPGYIDFFKAVLASFKEGPQKIYLGEGVYADPVLTYMDGRWDVFRWSFPDFRDGRYMGDFDAMRRIYRLEMRGHGRESA